MYHKLTVYVKSRYQTNLFPSCCFGDQYHEYEHHSINTLQISFIFYTLCITTCFIDARHGFNIYSILCPLDGVTCSVEQTCKQFISLEKTMSCVHLYAYTEQNAVGPFHGKSSQVEKNKLSNFAMKTSIYYFCIAYLICSNFFEKTINHCLVLAYVMHHTLHS